jgi:hypothetical protein
MIINQAYPIPPSLHPSQERLTLGKEESEIENAIQTYPIPSHPIYLSSIYLPCTYPVPTLDQLSIHAYPTPHQNPGPDLSRDQICPSLTRLPCTARQFSLPHTSMPTPRLLTTFLLLPTLQLSVGPGRARYSLLYVDRRCSSWTHARQDSGATFEFPQNSIVWKNKKIDSRPPNRKTISHT